MAGFWRCITAQQQKDRKRLGSVVPYIMQAETRREAKEKFQKRMHLNNPSQAICSPIVRREDLEEALQVIEHHSAFLQQKTGDHTEELAECAKVQAAIRAQIQTIEEFEKMVESIIEAEFGEQANKDRWGY